MFVDADSCDISSAGHNLKRAFQKSLLLHAVIYFMLFVFSAHLFLGATNMRESFLPPQPSHGALHAAPILTNDLCTSAVTSTQSSLGGRPH